MCRKTEIKPDQNNYIWVAEVKVAHLSALDKI